MELLSRIRHRRTRVLLSSYVDGEVSASERRRVEAHAAGCSDCRDEIESLRATVELVRALPELELPRSFELTRLPEKEPSTMFGVWAPRLATSVAGLLLVALLAADFAGTLTQFGGFDEEAMEMQSDAPPPPMAQAFQAAAAPTQAVELMSADAQAATPEASGAPPAPPAAPAAPAAMAQKSGPEGAAETPLPAAKARAEAAVQPSPEAAADAAGKAGSPGQPGAPASADVQAQEQTEAQAVPGSTPAPGDVIPIDVWEPSDDEDGFGVSLRQFQVAAAVCFLALAAVTVWLAADADAPACNVTNRPPGDPEQSAHPWRLY